MSKHIKNLKDQIFGQLKVVGNSGLKAKDGSVLWECECSCGNTVKLSSTQLRKYKSCGCLKVLSSRKYNRYEYVDGYVRVYDSKGKYALVDEEVLDAVKEFYWFEAHGYFKTVTGNKHSPINMHTFLYEKFIAPLEKGKEVDHKNRKKNDNRLFNLRPATRAENNINKDPVSTNTSGYAGVSYRKGYNNYRAYIVVNNKQIHLGVRPTAEEAYVLRLEAEKKYFGEFTSKKVGDNYVE